MCWCAVKKLLTHTHSLGRGMAPLQTPPQCATVPQQPTVSYVPPRHPKRQIDWFSRFCTARGIKSLYSTITSMTAKNSHGRGWRSSLRVLDLGSGQGHISMHNTYRTTSTLDHVTDWNLLGCLKLANRSQPLMSRSSPYCKDVWRRYCHLTSFFRLSIHALVAKIWPDKVVRWRRDGDFLRPVFFSEPRAAHFRHAFWIRTKAILCVEVW